MEKEFWYGLPPEEWEKRRKDFWHGFPPPPDMGGQQNPQQQNPQQQNPPLEATQEDEEKKKKRWRRLLEKHLGREHAEVFYRLGFREDEGEGEGGRGGGGWEGGEGDKKKDTVTVRRFVYLGIGLPTAAVESSQEVVKPPKVPGMPEGPPRGGGGVFVGPSTGGQGTGGQSGSGGQGGTGGGGGFKTFAECVKAGNLDRCFEQFKGKVTFKDCVDAGVDKYVCASNIEPQTYKQCLEWLSDQGYCYRAFAPQISTKDIIKGQDGHWYISYRGQPIKLNRQGGSSLYTAQLGDWLVAVQIINDVVHNVSVEYNPGGGGGGGDGTGGSGGGPGSSQGGGGNRSPDARFNECVREGWGEDVCRCVVYATMPIQCLQQIGKAPRDYNECIKMKIEKQICDYTFQTTPEMQKYRQCIESKKYAPVECECLALSKEPLKCLENIGRAPQTYEQCVEMGLPQNDCARYPRRGNTVNNPGNNNAGPGGGGPSDQFRGPEMPQEDPYRDYDTCLKYFDASHCEDYFKRRRVGSGGGGGGGGASGWGGQGGNRNNNPPTGGNVANNNVGNVNATNSGNATTGGGGGTGNNNTTNNPPAGGPSADAIAEQERWRQQSDKQPTTYSECVEMGYSHAYCAEKFSPSTSWFDYSNAPYDNKRAVAL
ncbi:MAG: hypothetical protein ACK4SY_08230 [Pyrobaculum sp.]